MIENSRYLRKNLTDVEKKLWRSIRYSQLGERFYRQRVIDDKYIVDFYCSGKKLIVELDGGQHCDCEEDENRNAYLKSRGYKILRFWNNEINDNLEACLEIIKENLVD